MSTNYYPNIPQPQTPQVIYVQNSSIIIRFVSYFISGLIIYLLIDYIISYLVDKFITQKTNSIDIWSNKYGVSYINKFDIRNVYKYQNESRWIYEVSNFFTNSKAMSELPMDKLYDFIVTYIEPHLYKKVPGKSYNSGRNFILPRHLVEGIQIKNEDNDADYETWLQNYQSDIKNKPKDPNTISMKKNNPLVWGSTPLEWRNRIAYWCGARSDKEISTFWTKDSGDGKGTGAEKWVVAVGASGLQTPSIITRQKAYESWNETFNDGKTLVNADNIFARYGFGFDSAAISYLANDDIAGTSSGERNARIAVLTLLGITAEGKPLPKTVMGGWIGYFKYFKGATQSGVGPLDILYSREDSSGIASNPYITQCPQVKKHKTDGWAIAGSIVGAIGAGMAAGAFTIGTGGVGLAVVGSALPGVLGAVKSGIGSDELVCEKDAE